MLGLGMDLTGRKLVEEEALREGEEQFRTLADNIPQLAWMARPDGWIFWYNRRWYEYTGTTLEQMEGWGWQAVHDPEHARRGWSTRSPALDQRARPGRTPSRCAARTGDTAGSSPGPCPSATARAA